MSTSSLGLYLLQSYQQGIRGGGNNGTNVTEDKINGPSELLRFFRSLSLSPATDAQIEQILEFLEDEGIIIRGATIERNDNGFRSIDARYVRGEIDLDLLGIDDSNFDTDAIIGNGFEINFLEDGIPGNTLGEDLSLVPFDEVDNLPEDSTDLSTPLSLGPILEQIVAQSRGVLEEITRITQQITEISLRSALKSAETALTNATLDEIGLRAQLALSIISTAANNISDTANLATRYAFGLAAKAQEIGLFLAQYREKTFNLLVQVEEGRTANTWARTKRAAQGFKY